MENIAHSRPKEAVILSKSFLFQVYFIINKYNTNATIEVNNIVINIDFSIVISHPICNCITNNNKKIQNKSESFSNSTIKLSISSIGIRVVEHFFNNLQALTALELEITLLLYSILIILNVLKTSIPLLSE